MGFTEKYLMKNAYLPKINIISYCNLGIRILANGSIQILVILSWL